MSHPEKEYLREQSYLLVEKEVMEREQWLEWEKQKPAKIEVIIEKEEIEIETIEI